MKPADFAYHRPSTVDEATTLLAAHGDEAKVLAGGQSLLPIMNMRLAAPQHLVDVTGIPALREVSADDQRIRYGARTTHMMVEDGLVPDAADGLLRQVAEGIGYRAIRTRGTMAGSLAHADSCAEWPLVLSALDATVRARSADGERDIAVREFLFGFFTTALRADEVVTEVLVPRWRGPWGFVKSTRKAGEFAESLAVALRGPDGLELWLGAARPAPVRLVQAERALADGADTVDDLVAAVGADIDVSVDEPDPVVRHGLQLHTATAHRAAVAARGVVSHA